MIIGPYSRQPYSRGMRRAGSFAVLRLEAFVGGVLQHESILDAGFVEIGLESFGSDSTIVQYVRDSGFITIELEPFGDQSIKASEDLYFIDEPVVEFQGRMATHVMVISPTHRYESALEDIALENKIERRVTIDVGDEEICKLTGERLLQKWGRAQRSVTGNVKLVVTTKFREKVRVWIPAANIINEYMILQRKVHDIGTVRTTLVLGDLILGEEEHLARVLQEM